MPTEMSCRICRNATGNKVHRAREMMFATRDEFDYIECAACGTVQIAVIPDLSKHYPADYYSMAIPGKTYIESEFRRRFAAPLVADYLMTGRGRVGKFFYDRARWIDARFPPYLRDPQLGLTKRSRVLDVGCGNGALLRDLRSFGFRQLYGADPFIGRDIDYPGIRIMKKSLSEVVGQFDVVMLNHSFEHLPDPENALREIRRLLDPNGCALIRIPVAARAWEKYGVNWFQLDPPRHLFLYTENAFRQLAESAGFEVVKVVYDSTEMQFIVSEQYARDIPMHDERAYRGDAESSIFTAEQIAVWKKEAEVLNRENRGDQACFYLRRSG